MNKHEFEFCDFGHQIIVATKLQYLECAFFNLQHNWCSSLFDMVKDFLIH